MEASPFSHLRRVSKTCSCGEGEPEKRDTCGVSLFPGQITNRRRDGEDL
jgi:hypothetical protein